MNKNFKFQVRATFLDFHHFGQAEFTTQDNATHPKTLPELRSQIIGRIRLHRQVNFNFRAHLTQPPHKTGVSHDQCVGTQVDCSKQSLLKGLDLDIARNHVTRQVEFLPETVGIFDTFGEVVQILETVFAGTERKGGLPRIDGIGTVGKGILHSGQITRRS